MSRRLGLFGGTFDPPHLGHLVVAQDVVERLELDRLFFVPAGEPPHKVEDRLSPAAVRLAMVQAAAGDDPRLGVSDVEVAREGPSYTVDTLRWYRERHPGAELFFLMGADQLVRFRSWREPREIARLARLVVMAREGVDPERLDPGIEVPFLRVPVTRVDISSTEVRRRIREGRSIRYLVPEPVRRIIEREGLYREGGTPPAPVP